MTERKLRRPPALEDGEYFVGKFYIQVNGELITIQSCEKFFMGHKNTTEIEMSSFSKGHCQLVYRKGKNSREARTKWLRLLRDKEWLPRKFRWR